MHSIMDVATVAGSCFKNNAHEMMVHMLMPCSYGCTDARQTPGVLHATSAMRTEVESCIAAVM
jgi:hypothetical protein